MSQPQQDSLSSPSPSEDETAPDEESNDSPPEPQPTQTIVRWVSLSLSSLVLVTILGLASYLWVSDRQQQPPILEVVPNEIRQSNSQFYVTFEVSNQGGRTAESVQVIAELRMNGMTVESGEQIFDFLSSQERANGTFIFTQDPGQGELTIRVASYQQP